MAVIWEGANSRRRRRGSYSQQHRPIFRGVDHGGDVCWCWVVVIVFVELVVVIATVVVVVVVSDYSSGHYHRCPRVW